MQGRKGGKGTGREEGRGDEGSAGTCMRHDRGDPNIYYVRCTERPDRGTMVSKGKQEKDVLFWTDTEGSEGLPAGEAANHTTSAALNQPGQERA